MTDALRSVHDDPRSGARRPERAGSTALIHGLATLDHGRDAVTVMVGDTHEGTWGPVDSKEHALDLIASDGWRPAPGSDWAIAPADNGRAISVVKGK